MLVNAPVTSRWCYYNSFLYSLPHKSLHKLLLLQNSAARLYPEPEDLWLNNSMLSVFIWSSLYLPSRTLCSSSASLLSVPSAHLTIMWLRAFSCSGPRLWKDFHQISRPWTLFLLSILSLKTHLFTTAYPSLLLVLLYCYVGWFYSCDFIYLFVCFYFAVLR